MRPFIARQAAARRCAARCRASTTRRPTPSSICGSSTAPSARRATRPRRARSRELMCTPTSRNLVRVFLLQDRLKGLGGKPDGGFPARSRRSAPASWAATSRPGRPCAGMTVTLQDRSDGVDRNRRWLAPRRCFEKRLKEPESGGEPPSRGSHGCGRQTASAAADVVIEAIFENADAKRALYARARAEAQAGRGPGDQHLQHQDRDACREAAAIRAAWSGFISSIRSRRCSWSRSSRAPARTPRRCSKALWFTRKLDKLPLPCKSAPGIRGQSYSDALHQ